MQNIEDLYELSPMQQGMLFHTLYAPESEVYFEQLLCILFGELNFSAFQKAWEQVVARHSVLRSSFYWEEIEKPLQMVSKQVDLPWVKLDWRNLTPDKQQNHLEEFLSSDRQKGFDLAQAPLMRFTIIQLTEQTYQFIWSHHHILFDGWSMQIILKEVLAFYEANQRGEHLRLQGVRPYREYIEWLQQQDIDKAKNFWQKTLQGFETPTLLGSNKGKEIYNEQRFELSQTVTEKLQLAARQHHLTLNNLVQGAYALLISRYSGETDVVFGATVSGRPPMFEQIDSMVGLLINTLPIRTQINRKTELLSWLKQIQTQALEQEQYAYFSLAEIQQMSDIPPGMPLFDSILVFENYPLDSAKQETQITLEISHISCFERTNYPITLVINPGSQLAGRIVYDTTRFDEQTIARMIGHFQTLLAGMADNLQQYISQLSLLSADEKKELVLLENHQQTNSINYKCIHVLFEEQVEKIPDAIAVVFADQQLTYRELNQRANQLAHHLQKLGVGPEVLVGICMERSLLMVIGLLGILKAGGAYVPIDPDYPQQRLTFFLQDCQTRILLTENKFQQTLSSHEIQLICLDSEWSTIAQDKSDNPVSGIAAHNLAYVIYTSGSTGVPKGAMNTHAGVCNRLLWMQDTYQLTLADRILQKTPFSFDVSVWEFFWPLFTGACLVVAQPGIHRDSAELVKLIAEQKITTIHFVPSMLAIFLEEQGLEACNCLKRVICSGEALSFNLQQRFFAHLAAELHNLYGPTEAAIDVTAWRCDRTSTRQEVPIGSAIANMQMYILDGQQDLVPVGIPGELYIGGVGLARGYYNRPELTAEKFIPHPFSQEPGKRLYKTGDLVRRLPDGNLEFIGRIDTQVKIRGFRIELAEIEAILGQHPDIKQVVVIAREDEPGNKFLVAYLVATNDSLTTSTLRNFLKAKLPDYMIPAAFVFIDKFPLTPNGKLNRRALPAPNSDQRNIEVDFVAPRTPIEQELALIWTEVLKLKQVGIHDNFFELGGHSLLATQVVSRLREAFTLDFPLRYLFENPTIAELAQKVNEQAENDDLARILAEVDELSEEEVRKQLVL